MGEFLCLLVTRPGEGEDFTTLPDRDLGNDMRSGAETIDPKLLAVPGFLQASPADQASAKQRRKGYRVCVRIQIESEACIGNDMGGKATIAGIAGEIWL